MGNVSEVGIRELRVFRRGFDILREQAGIYSIPEILHLEEPVSIGLCVHEAATLAGLQAHVRALLLGWDDGRLCIF